MILHYFLSHHTTRYTSYYHIIVLHNTVLYSRISEVAMPLDGRHAERDVRRRGPLQFLHQPRPALQKKPRGVQVLGEEGHHQRRSAVGVALVDIYWGAVHFAIILVVVVVIIIVVVVVGVGFVVGVAVTIIFIAAVVFVVIVVFGVVRVGLLLPFLVGLSPARHERRTAYHEILRISTLYDFFSVSFVRLTSLARIEYDMSLLPLLLLLPQLKYERLQIEFMILHIHF